MRELLHQYFNIAFLMGRPQDLPGGRDQMKMGVLLALVTYVMALAMPYGLSRALLLAIVDLGVTGVVLYLALSILGRQNRFDQAFGGLCGASAFINLAALPLYLLRVPDSASAESMMSFLPNFVLFVWGLSLLGHVIRHTFEVNVPLSIVISFIYTVIFYNLISALLPMQIVATSGVSSVNSELWYALIHWQQGLASV